MRFGLSLTVVILGACPLYGQEAVQYHVQLRLAEAINDGVITAPTLGLLANSRGRVFVGQEIEKKQVGIEMNVTLAESATGRRLAIGVEQSTVAYLPDGTPKITRRRESFETPVALDRPVFIFWAPVNGPPSWLKPTVTIPTPE